MRGSVRRGWPEGVFPENIYYFGEHFRQTRPDRDCRQAGFTIRLRLIVTNTLGLKDTPSYADMRGLHPLNKQ
jgi:hypothetical protein